MGFRIALANPVLDEETIQAAVEALRNERFLLGESVVKFEEEFAKFIGTKYAVAANSGTDALVFSLIACNVENKEVITTPMSFIATANAILYAKGMPVFADIEMETYNIDPNEISKKITEKTRCIMPVHIYGHPAKIDEILDIAKKHNLCVIEDACQSHGAEIDGKKVGSFGDAAAFSFYPSKNMTVGGDGGMITTDNEEIANLVRKLRDCGRVSKYEHDVLGYTSRLTSLNGAIGISQLRKLSGWNERRREIAMLYNKFLSNIEEITLPPGESEKIKPVYHLFVIRTNRRDELSEWLNKNEIEVGMHYSLPIHLQPVYRKMFGFSEGMYKNAEEVGRTCLSVPIHQHMTDDDVKFVCEKIHEFFK